MSSENWHSLIQNNLAEYGKKLGFEIGTELHIPRGRIDCVWEAKEPVPYYFIAFELETSTSGSQIVENMVKVLSLPPQKRPRFLVQIYRNHPKSLEYLEKIAETLPITTKIITSVGSNIQEASEKILLEVFNWISEYVVIPQQFLSRLERVVSRTNIYTVFHYGELTPSHLDYLDKALRFSIKEKILWIDSVCTDKNRYKFPSLTKYDLVIISDVSTKYCDLNALENFLENDVKEKGKSLILTGGHGLTKKYHLEFGKEKLGGKVGGRFDEKDLLTPVKIVNSKNNIGHGLEFKGFNIFKPVDPKEVIGYWDKDNYPALIVHQLGMGNVIVFTSDCSPAWGRPAIDKEDFKEMWRSILGNYC